MRLVILCGIACLLGPWTRSSAGEAPLAAPRAADTPAEGAEGPAAAQVGHSQQESRPGVASDRLENARPISLSVDVEARTASGWSKYFSSGEDARLLHNGDKFALHVEVDEPAYFYVGHRDPRGVRTILYPSSGHEQLSARADHRIPSAGRWFKLDNDTGLEDLFLYASKEPLGEEDLRKLLAQDSASAARTRVNRARPRTPSPSPKPEAPRQARLDEEMPGLLAENTRGIVIDEPDASEDLSKAHIVIRHRR